MHAACRETARWHENCKHLVCIGLRHCVRYHSLLFAVTNGSIFATCRIVKCGLSGLRGNCAHRGWTLPGMHDGKNSCPSLCGVRRMKVTSWQQRRGAFNHDWLKNRYLPAIAKWINVLDGQVDDPAMEKDFVSTVLVQWEEYRDEADAIVQDFERLMSPSQLLDSVACLRKAAISAPWLRPVVHELWVRRCAVRELVTEASARATETNQAYRNLRERLRKRKNTRSATALRGLRPQFTDFRDHCQRLARAIEVFPSEARVI